MPTCSGCCRPLSEQPCSQCGVNLPTREDWANAYAKQSQSDFDIFLLFHDSDNYALCHAMHYLQMAGEKIAKAYRFRDTATSTNSLLTSHMAFSKFFSSFLKSNRIKSMYRNRDAQLQIVIKDCKKLAEKVEKLAPAVDRSGAPDNAEYPWSAGNQIFVPCEYSYPNLTLLKEPSGRTFIQLLKISIQEFEELEIA